MRTILVTGIAVALLAGTAAYAHHSYGATYDVSKEIKLQGRLVQFVFRNPHAFVHIERRSKTGLFNAGPWSGAARHNSGRRV